MEQSIKILEIVTWPFVVSIAMLLFKKDLSNVLKRLTKVETSAAKMIFNEEINNVEKNLPHSSIKKPEESKDWQSEMIQIAKMNPLAAIIEAWTAIEVSCIEIGIFHGTTMRRFSPKALKTFYMKYLILKMK